MAHAISAGIPATSLPAVLVLAEADTMTSVAQWADMQQKRERALPIIRGSSNRFPHSRGGRQFNFERVAECKTPIWVLPYRAKMQVQILPRSPFSLSLLMSQRIQPLEHFRAYEPHLANIVARYPNPTELSFTGVGQSTVRINLKLALENYLNNPLWPSIIPRETVALILREFVFTDAPNGKVYIGPRRSRARHIPITMQSAGEDATIANAAATIPPIDCSNPTTLLSLLHLKNHDHIQLPITIFNCNPDNVPNLTTDYPNVEIIPSQDRSHFTIL